MRYLTTFTILVTMITLAGCNGHIEQESKTSFVVQEWDGPKPWTGKPVLNDPDNFQFVIVADLNGDNRPGIFEKAVEKINLMNPEFVLCVGDLIEGSTDDEYVVDKQWKAFEKLIAPLGMRFFFVPGNHDLKNNMMTEKWEDRFGRSYYHFVYRNVLFLCLNSEDPPSHHMSNAQAEYVAKALDENRDARWTMVFMHKPMWVSENTGWEKIEAMLVDRPHTVIAGHRHSYAKYVRHGRSYIILATTGAGSSLTGYRVGRFDHITWVTMKDEGPLIANLDIHCILDEDIVTEEIVPLLEGGWTRIGEVVSEKKIFESGTTEIGLENPTTLPLRLDLKFAENKNVALTPSTLNLTIPPTSSEVAKIAIKSSNPLDIGDIEPLELEITAVVPQEGRSPLELNNTHYIHFRGNWEGPQILKNNRFSRGLQQWRISRAKPETGSAKVISGELVVDAAERGDIWNIGTWQGIGRLQADTAYQFSLKARGLDSPNEIAVQFKDDDDKPINIVVDGKTLDTHLIKVSEVMSPLGFDFKIESKSKSIKAWLNIGFGSAEKIYIDDVSLRKVLDSSPGL
jgi:calcineurin-like phosphoesterase family protein